MIAVVHWLKRNNGAETHLGGGVLSAFVFQLITIACPLLWRHVHGNARAGNKNDEGKCYSMCDLFSAWKLQDTACDWSFQEACKLLIAYSQLLLIQRILWATETALFWQNRWVYPLIYSCIAHIYLLIYLVKRLVYRILSLSCELLCMCILRATVH